MVFVLFLVFFNSGLNSCSIVFSWRILDWSVYGRLAASVCRAFWLVAPHIYVMWNRRVWSDFHFHTPFYFPIYHYHYESPPDCQCYTFPQGPDYLLPQKVHVGGGGQNNILHVWCIRPGWTDTHSSPDVNKCEDGFWKQELTKSIVRMNSLRMNSEMWGWILKRGIEYLKCEDEFCEEKFWNVRI